MKVWPTLNVATAVIAVYFLASVYLLWSVVDRPFGNARRIVAERFSFSARHAIAGVNIGDRLTVHLLEGDVFKYADAFPGGTLATYSPFVPVLARYRIPADRKTAARQLINQLNFDGSTVKELIPTVRSLSSVLPIQHGAINSFTYALQSSYLRKNLWNQYLADPKISEEERGFGGQVFYFPTPPPVGKTETETFREEDLYQTQAVGLVAFLTFDELPLVDKKAYLKVAQDNIVKGLSEIAYYVDPSRGFSQDRPKSILLPALNTPMIAYDWVGQAQALAVREFAQRLSIRSKVTIVARAEYTNEESPSGRLHVFLVPYSRDGEEERRAYVSGIEAGLLAWRNPIYSILILVAVPLGIIVGYRLLKLKGQIPTNITHVLVVGLAVAFPVYKDLVPVQIALVLSSILAGKALRDNLDRKA